MERATSRASSLLPIAVISGAALVFLCCVALLFSVFPVGHDQPWYLIASQRYLSGATLYGPRIAETNPPLIVWLSAIPVLLARFTHIAPLTALRLVALAAVIAGTTWCIVLLRRRPLQTSALSLALQSVTVLLVEIIVGPDTFGQREHLLVILALPYLLAAATGAVHRISLAERCALGIAFSLGICLKPQYLLVLAAFEILLALYNRTLRRALSPEFLSLVLTGGVYLVLVRLLTPLYGRQILPLMLDAYWVYGTSSVLSLARESANFILIAVAALLACFVFRRYLRDPFTPAALLVCSLAAAVAYAIQKTDWSYHRYPFNALFLIAVIFLLIDLLQPLLIGLQQNASLSRLFSLALLGLQIIALCVFVAYPRLFIPDSLLSPPSALDSFFQRYPPSTTVYVFSTAVSPISPVFKHGLRWGSRFPALWLLPAVIRNEPGPSSPSNFSAPFKRLPPETLSHLAFLQRIEVAEDLDSWRPSVILVEQCTLDHPCQAIEGRDVDLISWFKQSPRFAAAWSHYQRRPGPAFFDCYVRIN